MKARIIEKTVDRPNGRTGRRFIVHVDSAYGDSARPRPLDIVCESKNAARQLRDALNSLDVLWVAD